MAERRALVLHSGGMDSTVCLLKALEECDSVESLGFDYGQHHDVELLYAEQQCARYNVPRTVITLRWSKPDRTIPMGRSVDDIRDEPSPAFLPARNMVFLTVALAHAGGTDSNEVWLGINDVDYSGYPDCTAAFLDVMRAAESVAFPGGPDIVAPLMGLSKPVIASMAKSRGLDRGSTWSCYRPDRVVHDLRPCGKCDACVLHDYAWDNIVSSRS